MFHESANPKQISQQSTPLVGPPSLSLTTKGSWIQLLGEDLQASHQLYDTQKVSVIR